MSDTIKITILKDTVCGSRPVTKGAVVDAGAADARLLIALKKARETRASELQEEGTPAGSKPPAETKSPETGEGGKGGAGGKETGAAG